MTKTNLLPDEIEVYHDKFGDLLAFKEFDLRVPGTRYVRADLVNSPHLCSSEQVNLKQQVSQGDALGNGDDLLPCPHCGCAKITIERDDVPWGIMRRTMMEWWKLRCDGCSANQTYPSRDGLIKRWNTRAAPAVDYAMIAPVAHYFNGDAEKTKLWFETPNPNLGGVKPINTPRDRLLKFITEQTAEPAVDAGELERALEWLEKFIAELPNGKADPDGCLYHVHKAARAHLESLRRRK